MNNVLIVGSIGLDNLKTPMGVKENVLGGSVSFASIAAKLFSSVSIVGVIGEDFPSQYLDLFEAKGINTEGLKAHQGKTFRWSGEYQGDMNEAITLDTQLNSFADFNPVLTSQQKDMDYLFLGNIQPDLQLNVLSQMNSPKFVMCDTMNLWINTMPEKLNKVINKVNLLLVNDKEARMLSGCDNLILAAQRILAMGPEYLVIKKGEHGAMLFSNQGEIFALPAFPMSELKDPTGAGDSFAGGFIGNLAQESTINFETLKRSMIAATVVASFTTQDFGPGMLKTVTMDDFAKRCNQFQNIIQAPALNFALV
jgi:sugar/nucleoside kinase (ribokinase family)